MSVQDWNTTPDSNGTIDGVNIAEGAPAGNMNNAIRRIMASVRVMYNNLPNVASLMPRTGGVFTGEIGRDQRGGYLHNNDSSSPSGRLIILPAGAAIPPLVNGDIVVTLE